MVTLFAAASAPAIRPSQLPNLVQAPPYGLRETNVDGRWHLGFASSVANLGAAPLLVRASRPNRAARAMTAWQIVGGRRVARAGVLRFDTDPTHAHWHLQPFEVYELRREADAGLVASARKAGFCLTDTLPAVTGAGRAKHTALCGRDRPDLVKVGEGISPGWSDVYGPEREGQFLDITDVPAGRYFVVNRVNGGAAIRETRHDDDIAATAIDLEWTGGAAASSTPSVTVIGTCAGAATCATLGIR